MSVSGPPDGWYPDPGDPRYLRRWDGAGWTGEVTSYRSSLGSSPAKLFEAEDRMLPWVRRAVVVYPLLAILSALLIWNGASAWQHYFHAYRVFFDQIGQTPYQQPPRLRVPIASYLGALVIAPEIVFVVWQFRAAHVARALGYPARQSPGWGVWAYLVPFADLFVPAMALSDCFPAGHPGRSIVARTWAVLLVSSLLQSSLIITLAEVRSVGLILLAASIVGQVVLLFLGRQLVNAVGDNHREAVTGGQML